MNVHFRLSYNVLKPGQQVIECWQDDQLIATIYPYYQGLRIVSKHTRLVTVDLQPPPATVITFLPEPEPPPDQPPATEDQP